MHFTAESDVVHPLIICQDGLQNLVVFLKTDGVSCFFLQAFQIRFGALQAEFGVLLLSVFLLADLVFKSGNFILLALNILLQRFIEIAVLLLTRDFRVRQVIHQQQPLIILILNERLNLFGVKPCNPTGNHRSKLIAKLTRGLPCRRSRN